MFRTSICLILSFCFAPIAGADVLTAGYAGCNTGGTCSGGAYQLTAGGDVSTWTFDYSIPNSDVKQISYLNNVVVNLEVFDTKNQQPPADGADFQGAQSLEADGAKEGCKIYLLVGGDDHTTAAYHLLLDTIGPTYLDSYTGADRDTITETLTDATELARFLKQLKKSNGDFSVEVVATHGDFYLGDRHQTPDGDPARFAALDVTDLPEPASVGTAGIGLIALLWTLRKKIRRSA